MSRRTRGWCAVALVALVEVRSAAFAAEAAAGDRERRVAELAGVLARTDVQTFHRIGAADELGRIGRGSAAAAKALTAALKDPNATLRITAAEGLIRVSRREAVNVGQPVFMEPLLKTGAAPRFGPEVEPAIPVLMKELREGRSEDRIMAGMALGELGAAAGGQVPELVKLVADPDASKRQTAISVLGELGLAVAGPEAVKAVTGAMKDAAAEVRQAAASALGDLGAGSEDAARALTAALEDGEPSVRMNAAVSLSEVDPVKGGVAAVPVLAAGLAVDDGTLGGMIAAEALGRIGQGAKAAVPALLKALAEDKRAGMRASAAETLGKIGDKAAAAGLEAALKDQASGVRADAAVALLRIDAGHAGAKEMLTKAVRGDPDGRYWAAMALMEVALSPEDAVPALAEFVRTGRWDQRLGGIRALRELGPGHAAAVPELVKALADADPRVRGAVAMGLGRIGKPAAAARGTLERLAKEDPDEAVRRAAAEAIGKL